MSKITVAYNLIRNQWLNTVSEPREWRGTYDNVYTTQAVSVGIQIALENTLKYKFFKLTVYYHTKLYINNTSSN